MEQATQEGSRKVARARKLDRPLDSQEGIQDFERGGGNRRRITSSQESAHKSDQAFPYKTHRSTSPDGGRVRFASMARRRSVCYRVR